MPTPRISEPVISVNVLDSTSMNLTPCSRILRPLLVNGISLVCQFNFGTHLGFRVRGLTHAGDDSHHFNTFKYGLY